MGMGSQDAMNLVFPWPWPLLQQTQQWLTSYQGHLRYAHCYGLWDHLVRRFDWLQEYFVWNTKNPKFRYPTPRYVRTVYQQRKWFADLLPDHVLMIQFGAYWEMAGKTLTEKRFPASADKKIRQILWEGKRPVAWIAETGRHITNISERVLVCRWAKCG